MKLPFNYLIKSRNTFCSIEVLEKAASLGVKDMTEVPNHTAEEPPNKKLCIEEKNDEVTPKIRNKKVALLLGYLGDDYHGMQVNTGFRTVEGELLSALCKAGFIRSEAVKEPGMIKFQRTARTDKGVSAAQQVVSLQLGMNYCLESVNKLLPEDIRVFSIKKVTKGFNCKNDCNARTYSYTLPTYALAPELHTSYPEKYRISEETMEKAKEILLSYVGTHKFHNFTVKKHFRDPSVKRYIMSLTLEKPVIQDDEEFVTVKIKGQSFMFHQIRKMVGHMIAVLKGIAPKDIQDEIWTDKKYSVPLAPGLGLVLENVHFDKYDRKFGTDGIHEPLLWNEKADELSQFRSFILSNIMKKEIERKSMYNWILVLSYHTYDIEEKNCKNQEADKNNEDVPSEEKLTAYIEE